jgi:hypothetical protein
MSEYLGLYIINFEPNKLNDCNIYVYVFYILVLLNYIKLY